MKKPLLLITALATLAIGCSETADQDANKREANTVAKMQRKLSVAQPAPTGDWSQLRQNVIDIETAQINTTATTTFFFNQGIGNPIKSCESVGFPIAATNQLTNPEAIAVKDHNVGVLSLPQQETTGVYTGDSTGTYVICIDPSGKGRITYWEGFVQTETGQATWDRTLGQITSTGASTADVAVKR